MVTDRFIFTKIKRDKDGEEIYLRKTADGKVEERKQWCLDKNNYLTVLEVRSAGYNVNDFAVSGTKATYWHKIVR